MNSNNRVVTILGGLLIAFLLPFQLKAQIVSQKENPVLLKGDTLYVSSDSIYQSSSAGEFSPSRGFDIHKSKLVSLNISFYGLARMIDQLPAKDTFTDVLGRKRATDPRLDIQWHRTLVWLSGHFLTPKFRYNMTIWGLASTQQALIFGNFQYQINKHFRLGVGIAPNLGIRALQFQWPYFHGSDRQMVEEFVRPGFTGSVWVSGEIVPKLNYTVNLGNNLSQLGVSSANLTRSLSKSATIWWLPSTGEFGPRNGNNDLEKHQKLATRFGASFTQNRENRSNEISNPNPLSTQIRMSDGVLLFETGALGPGVTIREADYLIVAVDAGFKYKGFHLQSEVFFRRLSNFDADGPLAFSAMQDNAMQVSASYPIISNRVVLYGVYGKVFDEFDRKPWEVSGGLNYYPSGSRAWRLNLHVIRVEKSPASSQFGYYISGQSGMTFSVGTDVLL